MDRMQTLERRVKDFERRTGKAAPDIMKLVSGVNGRERIGSASSARFAWDMMRS